MADTKPATSNGPLRHLNNGIRSLAKKLQPEAPSHERASSLRRSKSVGRVKDLGKSAQGSIEQCKPKKRTRMNLGFDSEGLNETSSVSSIDVPNKRSRPETIVPTTSTNTPSARAATTKSISSTRSNSSPPSKISVGTKEDYDPAKVRFRLSPPDHPSKGVSGPTKETGRIRRAMSLSQARCRTQSPEKNAEKVGGSARNFFANIKDKIISVSGRLPKADAGHWSESFTAFLEDKRACQYFREYLKTEFSEDNLDFAVACRQFRNITDKKKANRKAKFILTTFLKDGAAKWVNLDYKTKAAVKEASDAGVSPNMFRLAQDHIEDLMKNDSYKRFLESHCQ